jgi:HEPN domain-containing protein
MTPPRELSCQHADSLLNRAADHEIAPRFLLDRPEVPDAVVGFHLQQAAEVLLKAVLAAYAVVYERTHSLPVLRQLLRVNGIPLPEEFAALDELMPYAVETRYEEPPEDMAALDRCAARELLRQLRVWAEGQIELAVGEDA